MNAVQSPRRPSFNPIAPHGTRRLADADQFDLIDADEDVLFVAHRGRTSRAILKQQLASVKCFRDIVANYGEIRFALKLPTESHPGP